jgi:hypothetical protein
MFPWLMGGCPYMGIATLAVKGFVLTKVESENLLKDVVLTILSISFPFQRELAKIS